VTGRTGAGGLGGPSDFVLARERQGHWRRVDWVLVGSALCLSLLGSLLVWSATRPRLLDSGDDPQSFLKRHLVNLAVGLVIGAVVSFVDYRKLRVYTPVMYVASCLGLVGVLLVGTTINGAHSWIVLGGGFQLQPSEFAKVALIVGLALLFAERGSREDSRPGADVPLALGLAAVPMGLILLQPDVGTAMVFVFVILGMFTVAGVSGRWVGGLLAGGVLVAVAAVQLHLLQDYQLDRFRAFTNPDENTQGAAYNITQARIAIGSGGLTGTGLFKGTQTNGKFVPEQQTDFVFTVAGEELGFLGAGGIILLFGIMLWRTLRLAGRSPDLFGRLVAAGIASWFAFQTFVNIGMTLGITPVTGLPLPFASYGGSSMFANWMAVGLLLNVHGRVRDAATV
jgi:rod shape determining protein RodA